MTSVPDLLAHGARALREGANATAIDAFGRAVALDPDQPEAWFNLGWLHRAERRFPEALDAYAQAISFGVDRPEEAYLNRAAILSDHMFRPDKAIGELRTALALNVAFVPALISLGSVAEDLGREDEARDAYRAALAIDPGQGRALARVAALDTFAGQARVAAMALEAALPLARTDDDRADMLFALGTAFDAQGAYDRAWQAYEAGNRFARSVATVTYDARAHEQLIDRLIAAFPRPFHPVEAEMGPTPVFICGMFRSGSTLAEQMLGRHPAVAAKGELEIIPALARATQSYPDTLADLNLTRWRKLRDTYLAELGPVTANARVFTDKRCDNYLHIGLIKAMFPHAQIVETRRQPLDNLLSVWFLRFGEGVPYAHDLHDAAHRYIHYRRLMAHWHALYPDSIHCFDYDAAVAASRPAVGTLLDALGLSFDEACLHPEQGRGAVRTASAWQVRQPLHMRSSGRWRHYEQHLGQVRAMLAAAGL